ncbi:MAG: hypothetical protein ACRELE_11500, partial [Gemmatimonadales bacterium]
VYLFKPADSINVIQGGDNGTPLQKDEPQAQNPPDGVCIDYYLKRAAAGPVTLEILDATGAVVHTFTTEVSTPPAAPGARGGGNRIPRTSPLWRSAPEPFSASAGMHRVVWSPMTGGRGGRGGGAASAPPQLTGTFTAKLTVGGQSYTEAFAMKPDPRTR